VPFFTFSKSSTNFYEELSPILFVGGTTEIWKLFLIWLTIPAVILVCFQFFFVARGEFSGEKGCGEAGVS
jgi:hypothetical protein